MFQNISDLSRSIQTGFVDYQIQSKKGYRPELILNSKEKGKKVLTTIERELRSCDEFWFSVAFLTSSGFATLANAFKELEEKGVKGKVLVSQYLNFTQPEALKKISQLKNIELKIMTKGDFHSKGYLFKNKDIYNLIIGSSNLTQAALCKNKEWNLKVSASSSSELIYQTIEEFKSEFDKATPVTSEFILKYDLHYRGQFEYNKQILEYLLPEKSEVILPNIMQIEALENLKNLRAKKKSKALLISATGTGKTFLAAFDVLEFKPKKLLFIVHRLTIAQEAMKSFKKILGDKIKMGIYSGSEKTLDADYIFSTVQTISKVEHLERFNNLEFDYIVIDETHRAGADSYKRIINYFNPSFLLGMTATPERTDGLDIFQLFDYNIAFEIRLHRALEEEMLSPFHYYGVTDISINDEIISDKRDFNLLTSKERVDKIIEKSNYYGCDNGNLRGLIFCSKNEESKELSIEFNKRGFLTCSLDKDSSEEKRKDAIRLLQSDDKSEKLDYIFTVDIFNEGIDIPKINQIIMLRPTQSAIVFIQQLGRGLRKIDSKEYLTVIDFIGNYSNNFLIPIALYGDKSYNKDTLRNLISTGSQLIPGASTINFDKITKERIYEAIDTANFQLKKDLLNDYNNLKFILGRIPMMIDFIDHGTRDAYSFVSYSKSYYNFVSSIDKEFNAELNSAQIKLQELFSLEINNSKRIEESFLLNELLKSNQISKSNFQTLIHNTYGYHIDDSTIESCVNNINFKFVRQNFDIIELNESMISLSIHFKKNILTDSFKFFLKDNIDYSIKKFNESFKIKNYIKGFVIGNKYSRKDVCRILNWEFNEEATVYGYKIKDGSAPLFVNYHKADGISESTKYDDGFINNSEFKWMTKSNRTLNSNDVKSIKEHNNLLNILLFIKKHNGEGSDFYFIGQVIPKDDSFKEVKMKDKNQNDIPVVKLEFILTTPVEDHLYEYLTESTS
jgi:superfamily II DNA or RNA helicase/HKD family nuclease